MSSDPGAHRLYPESTFGEKVEGLPTVLFVKDMGVVARVEGMLMADELQQLADQHFFGGAKPTAEGAA